MPAVENPDRRLDDLPLMERTGIRYLRDLARQMPTQRHTDAVHLLNAMERGELRKIERGAVMRSALAGGLSALIAALAVMLAEHLYPEGGWRYWLISISIAGGAAVVEIGYLYWDALKTTMKLTHAAGLPLFDEDDDAHDLELASSLARAALELPNPTEQVGGVNPLAEAPRGKLILMGLLYKGKVAVTNFALKVVIRRIAGRVLVRGAEELIAIPVTALWNAIVTWLVVREARLRIVGPSAAVHLIDRLWEETAPASPQREGAVRAVASAVVRSHDMHPNMLALLKQVQGRMESANEGVDVDDSAAFIAELASETPATQRFLLAVLTLAAITDGRLAGAERALLTEAYAACQLPLNIAEIQTLATRLRQGDVISASDLLPG